MSQGTIMMTPIISANLSGTCASLLNGSFAQSTKSSPSSLSSSSSSSSLSSLSSATFPESFFGERYCVHTGMNRLFQECVSYPLSYSSFETSVSQALKKGVFQRLLDVEEELELTDSSPVSEPHSYFIVSDVKIEPLESIIGISILFKGTEGNVLERKYKWIFEGDYQNRREELYHALDKKACEYIKQEFSELYIDQTRRVTLRGKFSQKFYTVYYKFGKSSPMEILGPQLLPQLGMQAPRVVVGEGGAHVWMQEIKVHPWHHVFNPFFNMYHGSRQRAHFEDRDLSTAFKQLGTISALMLVLGNEDTHFQNVFLVDGDNATTLDWEAVGEELHISGNKDLESQSNTKCINEMLNRTYYRLMTTLIGKQPFSFRVSPPSLVHRFEEGAEDFFSSVNELPLQDLIFGSGLSCFYPRVILRPSAGYTEDLKAQDSFAIPHYSFKTFHAEFQAFVRERIGKINEFMNEGEFCTLDAGKY